MNAKPADLVSQSVRTSQTYSEVLPHIKSLVSTSDLNSCKAMISQIKKIIKDRKVTPPQKLLALELFQECMMLKNPHFLGYAQTKILDRLSILSQKKPIDVFRDSNKSAESLLASERFLLNLRAYLQIWGTQFGKTGDGQNSLFAVVYHKLKEHKVEFPPIQPVAPVRKSQPPVQAEPRKSVAKSRSDKETIDYFENLLTIIEEIDNPYMDETGKELINNLMHLKGDVDNLLNTALANENAEEVDKLFQLSERLQVIESGNNRSMYSTAPVRKPQAAETLPPRRKAEIAAPPVKYDPPAPSFDPKEAPINRISTPPKKTDIFENILDLDFCPEPVSASQFRTYHPSNPPLFPSPVLQKSVADIFPIPFSVYQPTKEGPLPGILSDSSAEIAALKKALQEKDEVIARLHASLQGLEGVLKQTKEILASKERECEEYHCLKPSAAASNQDDIFEDFLLSPRAAATKVKTFEPRADNDDVFRMLCVESLAVLFDCSTLQIGFQLSTDSSVMNMVLYIGNKTQETLANINIDVENAGSYKVDVGTRLIENLPSGQQKSFEITFKMQGITHVYPRLQVKLKKGVENLEYSLKMPVCLGKFAEPIRFSKDALWKEWDEMMFASESCVEKCGKYRKYLPKILQFSENVKILTQEDLPRLESGQYLVLLGIKELVLVMVTASKSKGTCEIESRSNNVELRQSFLQLLLSQLSEQAS